MIGENEFFRESGGKTRVRVFLVTMVLQPASQTKGSRSKTKPPGKPVVAKKASSSFSRPEVALAERNASKPEVLPPATKSADPRLQVATAVANQVSNVLGLPTSKAKALGLAVIEGVVEAVPENIPARAVKEVLAKVAGPPPEVVHHIVPIGLLGGVAAKMPPVSEEVMVQALVNP